MRLESGGEGGGLDRKRRSPLPVYACWCGGEAVEGIIIQGRRLPGSHLHQSIFISFVPKYSKGMGGGNMLKTFHFVFYHLCPQQCVRLS